MPAPDLALLTDVARAAGEIALGFFRAENRVWDKGSDDPVSEADLAVDTYLRETLTTARPDYGWLSEETEDDADRLRRSRAFIVDPIDGTRAFISGEKTWAHSIAIVDGGAPVAAAVYLPALGKMYTAGAGDGAALNGTKITGAELPDRPRLLASRPALQTRHWPRGLPEIDRHFRPSLAYRMSLVAEGRFDAMLTLRDSWEWDLAAGALIAAEAGLNVSDRAGDPLRFNTQGRMTPGVIVAQSPLHEDLLYRLGVD